MTRALGAVLALACAPVTAGSESATPRRAAEPAPLLAPPGRLPPAPAPKLSLPEPEPSPPPPAAEPRCPAEMALVRRMKGPYCIDRWEASLVRVLPDGREQPWPGNRTVDGVEREVRAVSVAGQRPQGYVSGEQAALACANAGKRLCEIDEWVVACRGAALGRYPYGPSRRAGVCNDRFKVLDHHPVPRLFHAHAPPGTDPVLMWHPSWMNDPRLHEMDHTIAPTGSHAGCANEHAVFDQVGNLHEWVADPEGTFFGGFFMDTYQNGEGCEYRTRGHPFEYHDYSTGFRCCADPRIESSRPAVPPDHVAPAAPPS